MKRVKHHCISLFVRRQIPIIIGKSKDDTEPSNRLKSIDIVVDLCEDLDVINACCEGDSPNDSYYWHKKFGGLAYPPLPIMKSPEKETARLKKVFVGLQLGKMILKSLDHLKPRALRGHSSVKLSFATSKIKKNGGAIRYYHSNRFINKGAYPTGGHVREHFHNRSNGTKMVWAICKSEPNDARIHSITQSHKCVEKLKSGQNLTNIAKAERISDDRL